MIVIIMIIIIMIFSETCLLKRNHKYEKTDKIEKVTTILSTDLVTKENYHYYK